MRWSRWEPGSIRGVTAQSAGHRIDFRQVGNLVVVAQSHWRTTVLAQRDLVEMRWLADCLTAAGGDVESLPCLASPSSSHTTIFRAGSDIRRNTPTTAGW
jgi:hypothetical protein